MTLFKRAFAPRASIENPSVPISGANVAELFGGGMSNAGISVTELGSLNLAAVFRAVSLGAGIEAALPFDAYTKAPDGSRAKADDSARRIVAEPHPDMTTYEWRETLGLHRRLWGNAYCRIVRDPSMGNRISELWPIHPGRVKPGRTSNGTKIYSLDGGREVHTDKTMLHLPGIGYDGVAGVSRIAFARHSLGLGLAAEQFGAKFFANGSLATGILHTDKTLTPEQADTLHKRWKAKRAGLASAHETMILDSGAKFEQLTIPPEDAQFLQTREFQTSEISRWFDTPPFLMYQTEKSTSWGTGLEQQATGWVTFDMGRELIRVEQRFTKHLLAPDYKAYAKHNVEGLLRGDSKTRAEFYTKLWSLGVLSTNEIRELEDRAAVDGGDVRYRPLNMGELGTVEGVDDPSLSPGSAPDSETPSARVRTRDAASNHQTPDTEEALADA